MKKPFFSTKGRKNILSDIMCVIVATTMGHMEEHEHPFYQVLGYKHIVVTK
jgi:hypothetical protein